MKKLLFFLFATIVFASCSNVSEELVTPTGKTYKVTFNVSNFDIDTKPLKAGDLSQLYYTIYEKESGRAIKFRHSYSPVDPHIVEEVPAGSYYIVFISAYRGLRDIDSNIFIEDPEGTSVDITNFNFYTDYCSGSTWLSDASFQHYGLYYGKVDFTVGIGNEEVNKDVELQPKWSNVSVQITDGETCTLPEGTTKVILAISPFYYGFNIADGITSKSYEGDLAADILLGPAQASVSEFREKGLSNKVIMGSKGATAELLFVHYTESSIVPSIVGRRVIYTGDLDGGKRITLRGALGKTTSTGTFNVSLADLADGGVIPFN